MPGHRIQALFYSTLMVNLSYAFLAYNEFSVPASLLDDLGNQIGNCTSTLDQDLTVFYCGDGFFSIFRTENFLSPAVFRQESALKINLKGEPQSVL